MQPTMASFVALMLSCGQAAARHLSFVHLPHSYVRALPCRSHLACHARHLGTFKSTASGQPSLMQMQLTGTYTEDDIDDLEELYTPYEEGDSRPPPKPRKSRQKAGLKKTPNLLGRPGLKNFVPRDIDKVRPSLDDVERISKGQRAKRRGTGSRATPHRLNSDEREEWERGKRRGYLVIKGSGYRKERKGAPLINLWRQYNDACARASVWVELRGDMDSCVVDASSMRTLELEQTGSVCAAVAAAHGCVVHSAPPISWAATIASLHDPPLDLDTNPSEGESGVEQVLCSRPIWDLPFHSTVFTGSREQVKSLAAALAVTEALQESS